MRLDELFDQPYSCTAKDVGGTHRFEFMSAVGPYTIEITETSRVKSPRYQGHTPVGKAYTFMFGDGLDTKVSTKATGKNEDMYRILSTVIDVMLKFTKTKSVLEFQFAAAEEELSRIRLYDSMCKDIAKKSNLRLVLRELNYDMDYVLCNMDIPV